MLCDEVKCTKKPPVARQCRPLHSFLVLLFKELDRGELALACGGEGGGGSSADLGLLGVA